MTFLVAFSPHKRDQAAAELACHLARSEGDQVHAVSVVPQGWPTAVAGDTDREYEVWSAEQGEAAADEALAALSAHPEVTSTASWVTGRSVPQALLGQAEQLGASLIVVGSGDDGPEGRITVTSKTDRLLHSSPIPVAVAPRGFHAPSGKVARVTLGFRGDDETWALLDRVAEIAKRVGASVRLVTFAVRSPMMIPPVVSRGEDQVHAQWQRQASEALAEASDHLRGLGFAEDQVATQVAAGGSWASAVDQVGWREDDLLVVGSSSTHRLAQVFLGSSATKIVRHCPAPVIVVPAGA